MITLYFGEINLLKNCDIIFKESLLKPKCDQHQ